MFPASRNGLIQEHEMPSPFPGMNPYLERDGVWHSFHEQFCTRCLETLVPQVRPNYIVRTDETVYIHELDVAERNLVGRPDAFVTQTRKVAPPATKSGAVLSAPLYTRLEMIAIDEERLTYLKILDRRSREVVTVIELLSPSNKAADYQEYLAKRQHYVNGVVGLVEIDLLRGGRRLPLEEPQECDYCIMVARPQELPRVGVWPLKLADRLPIVPIPLRPGDADAKLDLQELLHGIYDAGGYEDYIYEDEPEPPLRSADAQWAAQFIHR